VRLKGHVARMSETRTYTKFNKDHLKQLVVNMRMILKCTAELCDNVQCHISPDWGSETDRCADVK
jgi:hypothetical protein